MGNYRHVHTHKGGNQEKKRTAIHHNQVEVGLDDEEVNCRELEGPAATIGAGLADGALPAGVEPCRRMTMRPSECAEKIASTATSSSATLAVGRGRGCRGRTGAGAAVCATARDECGWGPPAPLRPLRPWRGCGCGGSGSIRSTESRPRG